MQTFMHCLVNVTNILSFNDMIITLFCTTIGYVVKGYLFFGKKPTPTLSDIRRY